MVTYRQSIQYNSIIDLRDINYTDGEQTLKELIAITEPFCDNKMLVNITDSKDCKGKRYC